MPWFLYMIECVDGSLYTGIATDVSGRFEKHCSGRGAKYTRAHPPRRIVYQKKFRDRSMASKAEWAMKQLSREEKLAVVRRGKKRGR